jgi:tetratricopeptide (TPR) repeat protein
MVVLNHLVVVRIRRRKYASLRNKNTLIFHMKRILILALLFLTTPIRAQVMTDAAMRQTILQGLDAIYGYDFATADAVIRQFRIRYPLHPAGPMLRAVQLQWANIPLKDSKTATAQYVQAAEQTLDLAKKILAKDDDDPEAVFFALTAHGYLALKHNDEGEIMRAVGEARNAYGYMKEGFNLTERNPEFYSTTGLYNYYAVRYPADHSIVKPAMVFFKNGDMSLGLRQLEIAAKRGVFTGVEARVYLAHIFLEHESEFGRAAATLKPLVDRYPSNPVFLMLYTESLLLQNQFDAARPLLQRLKQLNRSKLLAMPLLVFQGLVTEKADTNDREATAHYQAALKLPYIEVHTKEYHGMAYAGLARIAARANNRPLARNLYKKAVAIGEYKSLWAEAKAFK